MSLAASVVVLLFVLNKRNKEIIKLNNVINSQNNTIIVEWTKSMYESYMDKWNNMFEEMDYPIDSWTEKKIGGLLWNIASKTIDYLVVINHSPNKLQRHVNSVNDVIKKNRNNTDATTFHKDITTVPVKAVAIYDWLNKYCEKDNYMAFGYELKVNENE